MGFLGDVNAQYGDDLERSVDVINGGGVQGAITVGTSAVVARVGGSNLTNRISLTVFNNSTATIYWGYTNAVTTSTGTAIAKGQMFFFSVGSATDIYLIGGVAGLNVRITEGAA